MNNPPRILVAYKKSRYEHFVQDEQDDTILRLIKEEHISVRSLIDSHQRHQASLASIRNHLDHLQLRYDCRYRGEVFDTKHYDLVIAVGGDGTVLELSHRITDTPLLAINSDPINSVGYFTAGNAEDFPELFTRTLEGKWDAHELNRFAVRINDKLLNFPVLNDILVCHVNPAAVSDYLLQIGTNPPEAQKSSGIWISTAAGSTAAIRSAGGQVMPFHSDSIQYLVREPYHQPGRPYRFLRGIQSMDEGLQIISRMRHGSVFLDGPHIQYSFTTGDTVSVENCAPRLKIFGISDWRRVG